MSQADLVADSVPFVLTATEILARLQELAEILLDCVDGGASVGFMAPLSRVSADRFWRSCAEAAKRGERIILGVEDVSGRLVGTVQLVVRQPENAPHRAEVAKLLVHRRARRTGIGAALMTAVEETAIAAGKSLLMLDSGTPEAQRLYERSGWTRLGAAPGYALKPGGGLNTSIFYYKNLRPAERGALARNARP